VSDNKVTSIQEARDKRNQLVRLTWETTRDGRVRPCGPKHGKKFPFDRITPPESISQEVDNPIRCSTHPVQNTGIISAGDDFYLDGLSGSAGDVHHNSVFENCELNSVEGGEDV